MIAALTEAPPVDSVQKQVVVRLADRNLRRKPGSATDGVALHAARIGGGFENPSLLGSSRAQPERRPSDQASPTRRR